MACEAWHSGPRKHARPDGRQGFSRRMSGMQMDKADFAVLGAKPDRGNHHLHPCLSLFIRLDKRSDHLRPPLPRPATNGCHTKRTIQVHAHHGMRSVGTAAQENTRGCPDGRQGFSRRMSGMQMDKADFAVVGAKPDRGNHHLHPCLSLFIRLDKRSDHLRPPLPRPATSGCTPKEPFRFTPSWHAKRGTAAQENTRARTAAKAFQGG